MLLGVGALAATKPGTANRPPRPLKIVQPEHPAWLREQRIIGNAEIRCIIDEDGRPTELKVDSATMPEFGEAALRAVAASTFEPALVAGKPGKMAVSLPVAFRFSEADRADYQARRPREELPDGPPTIKAPDVDEFPELLKEIRPKLPPDFSRSNLVAMATVGLIVDEQGVPRDIHLVFSTDPGCGNAAVEVIRQWRFVPGKKDGLTSRVAMEATLSFLPENPERSGLLVRPGVSRDFGPHLKGHEIAATNSKKGEHWSPPRVIKRKQPDYPDEMRDRNKQGEAMVEMLINPAGVVTHVRAVSSTNAYFAIEAERAASYWRFEPARKNGKPTAGHVQQQFIFSLQ